MSCELLALNSVNNNLKLKTYNLKLTHGGHYVPKY